MALPWWVKGYDEKLLKQLSDSTSELARLFEERLGPMTEERNREIEVSNRWYNRRITRVRRVMEAYHISGSELCDCDY